MSEHFLNNTDSIGLAISWGPDSMCLLYAIQSRWQHHKKNISSLHIMTCDHNTRENIKKEIDLVKNTSQGATFVRFHYTGSDYSEHTLRERRHTQFVNYCKKNNISFLLTWHHLDDRIETTLLNMKRWTGIKGISSITVSDTHFLNKNITILRPLLRHTKQEILDYCKEHKLLYVIDPTNSDIKYSERNAIRKIISENLWTPQFYKSRQILYESIEDSLQEQKIDSVQMIHLPDNDLIARKSGERNADTLYTLYKTYHISINPRASTLQTLCDQLNKKSGNKISYQWLTITAYQYGSTIRKTQQ